MMYLLWVMGIDALLISTDGHWVGSWTVGWNRKYGAGGGGQAGTRDTNMRLFCPVPA